MTDLTQDEKRLLWIVAESGIDEISGVDLHERTCAIAGGDADIVTDRDALTAIREAIDAGIAESWGDRP